MLINTIADSGGLAAANAVKIPSNSAEELQKNFMTMLVAQIRNQDPLKPLDNAELTSQLAQINTVAGIRQLNETLKSVNSQIEAGTALHWAGLIGRGVMVPGDRLLVGSNGAITPFGIDLATDAQEVSATIINSSGQAVRSFDLGSMSAGYDSFVWDGTVESGGAAPPGAYQVVIQALNSEGRLVEARTTNFAVISAVNTEQGGSTRLDLGGISEPVELSEVRQIL